MSAIALSSCGTTSTTVGTYCKVPVYGIFTEYLGYPPSDSVSVSRAIGQIVVVNQNVAQYGPETLTVSAGSSVIAKGPPAAAASPLPSPLVTPSPPPDGPLHYTTLALPMLAPLTTYKVVNSVDLTMASPAPCPWEQTLTQVVGTFSTGL